MSNALLQVGLGGSALPPIPLPISFWCCQPAPRKPVLPLAVLPAGGAHLAPALGRLLLRRLLLEAVLLDALQASKV